MLSEDCTNQIISAISSAPGGALPGSQYNGGHHQDTTGQVAPPGMKPRVTATLWEDEGSLCFQVEAKGVCVARREGEPRQSNPYRQKLEG
jgi:hypothetical protein